MTGILRGLSGRGADDPPAAGHGGRSQSREQALDLGQEIGGRLINLESFGVDEMEIDLRTTSTRAKTCRCDDCQRTLQVLLAGQGQEVAVVSEDESHA